MKQNLQKLRFLGYNPPESHETCNNLAGSTSAMESTPVKITLTARKWLEIVTSKLPSEPSAEFKKILVAHGVSIVDEVTRRAEIVLTALFPTSRLGKQQSVSSMEDINSMERLWSEKRRNEALKLYYRILESICQSEAENLSSNDHLGGFLTNERFHRCLLACSAELVSAVLTGNGMLLPMLFDRTGITAFDLSKVIESFVIHEPTLPRELKRHLNSLEEQLIEMRVWEKGSSLYDHLIVARPSLSPEINQLQLLAKPMPSLETIALQIPVYFGGLVSSTILKKFDILPAQDRGTVSPKRACKEHRDTVRKHDTNSPKSFSPPAFNSLLTKPKPGTPSPTSPQAFTSPTGSNAHGDAACSDTAISILFGKMAKLAAIRIQSLSERLKLAQNFREKVYFLFQQILTQKTTLFFNRHINQIIICCFYGLAKTSGINLTLKKIFHNYTKHPGFRSPVFSPVSGSHERNVEQYSEMITFYNGIFIPSVKSFLEGIGNAESPTKIPEINNNNGSPTCHHTSPFPRLPDISPRKVSPSHNVYLSPVRLSKQDDLTSSTATSLYAFVGESIYPYETPSKQLLQINDRLNRSKKVKRQLNFENEDAVMISDDVVVNSLFIQNNK